MTADIIPFAPRPRPLTTDERLRAACSKLGVTAPEPAETTLQMTKAQADALRRFATAFFNHRGKQPDAD